MSLRTGDTRIPIQPRSPIWSESRFQRRPTKNVSLDFEVFSETFHEILGPTPLLTLIEEKDFAFAHEAGIYDKVTESVWFTANWQSSRNPLKVHRVHTQTRKVEEAEVPELINANGGCQYNDGLLFCAQGDQESAYSAALIWLDTASGHRKIILDHYRDRPFNSPNDVVVEHPTGNIWFTDPDYGYAQGFRSSPQLPNQVYRFDPTTGECNVVEADIRKPNGLCFSPDYNHMYITDTAAMDAHDEVGKVYFKPNCPATIYKFDVVKGTLCNKRTFAFVDSGIPDGIKYDTQGNVFTGCGDGIHVLHPQSGSLLGKILVPGGVANFQFARDKLWIFNELKLWVAEIDARGCLEAIECHI